MAPEALNSPPATRSPDPAAAAAHEVFDSLTKRKRSKRPRSETTPNVFATEEEYLATCLIMLAGGDDGIPALVSSPRSISKTTTTATPPAKAAATKVEPQPQNHAYKCSVCDRSFPTYQALGGHKASHRTKPPATSVTVYNENKPSTSNSTGTAATSNISSLNPTGRAHICSVCKRSFPSGQALGGHKRRHYEGQIGGHHNSGGGGAVVPSNTSGVTSSEGAVSSHKPHLDFDLNLPASPEELGLELGLGLSVDCGNKSEIYRDDHEVESPMPTAAKKLRLSFPVDLEFAASIN